VSSNNAKLCLKSFACGKTLLAEKLCLRKEFTKNLMRLTFLMLLVVGATAAQTAPPVTGIQAIQQDGQTFITWNDAGLGATGSNYRYDIYRSTSGPITSLTSATLVQYGVYNNSAQLIGPKPYNQTTRQTTTNPQSTLQNDGTELPLWSGLAVYTNMALGRAYYAVITREITGAVTNSPIVAGSNATTTAVSESEASILPILQIPGTAASRKVGCSNCEVTSASVGRPMWLKLHPSGGRAAAWGDYWAYWGNSNMGFQDGTQSMFAVYQDPTGTTFNSGFVNQLIFTPQDAVWTEAGGGNDATASAESETYWYGYNAEAAFPGAYNPATNSAAYIFPYTESKLAFILPWAIAHYQPNPNRIFAQGESMGGYGVSTWALRQPKTFAGAFMAIPIIGPWLKLPQIDYGAASGTVAVTNGSTRVAWASGPDFGEYLAGPTIFNLTIDGITKSVSTVVSAAQLTLSTAWTGASGIYSYVTGDGSGCAGAPACGAGLATINTTAVDTLPNNVSQYNTDTNTPAWIAENCGLDIPYVGWAAGRLDTTTTGMWNMSVLFANALATCHFGFSFAWANDIHGAATAGLLKPLTGTYSPQLYLNVSYPAFTSFSLDSAYGNGSTTNGACTTGNATAGPVCYVNYGWNWTTPTDTATSWSTTLSNSQLTSGTCPTTSCATTATVSITARNTQSFKPAAGSTITWKATGGQDGSITVDVYGLATVTGIKLTTSATTVTLTATKP
jgi:hypothetical protein